MPTTGRQPITVHSFRCRLAHWVVLIGLAALLTLHGLAQQANTAGVLGTVFDAQGAVVPGATVTMTNQETKQVRVDVSDSRGDFRVQLLPVGHYAMTVTKSGFENYSLPDLLLQVNDNLKIQPKLSVGRVAVNVDVNNATQRHVRRFESQPTRCYPVAGKREWHRDHDSSRESDTSNQKRRIALL